MLFLEQLEQKTAMMTRYAIARARGLSSNGSLSERFMPTSSNPVKYFPAHATANIQQDCSSHMAITLSLGQKRY